MTDKANQIEVFYKPVLRLTMPIIIQNMLSVAVSSADVLMLSRVGQSAVAASSLASQYTQTLLMIAYGLGTGITMLSSQYWGRKDVRAINLIEGIALRFSLVISGLLTVCALTIPQWMMRVYTNDPELIRQGVEYLRLVSVSYICWGICEVYLSALRSVERVSISTFLNALALGMNVCLNAVFIFGLFGAPKLGIAGVALATSISRFAELIGCIVVSSRSENVKLSIRAMFVRNKVLFGDFLKLSLPAVGNDVSWGVAFSLYSAILGHLSSDMVAANSIVTVVRNFSTILCFSLASAITIWLGKKIGQNKMEEARKDASRFMFLTVITGLIGGVIILLGIPAALRFSNLEPNAMKYLKAMLLINTYYVMGIAVNTSLVCGVFRSGGDSRFGLICDTIDMWGYALPVGFLAAFVLKLPHLAVYFLLCTDEFVKWPWVIGHYRSGKWLRNITKEYDGT